jgi:hypothetical protein
MIIFIFISMCLSSAYLFICDRLGLWRKNYFAGLGGAFFVGFLSIMIPGIGFDKYDFVERCMFGLIIGILQSQVYVVIVRGVFEKR